MTKKNYFAIILSMIMAFSAVTAVSLAFTPSSIVAYAASISAPSVKASNASYNSVKLTWKKVKGAKKYIVMRSTKKSSGYKTLKTVTKTTYTDSKATCGKTYYYKVTAVKGNTKKTSKAVKIKCVPAKVSSVKAVSSNCGDITISFKSVKGASGYNIAYCSTKNGTFKSVASVKTLSYTHSTGTGSTGYYKVRAYRTVKGKKIYGAYSAVKAATAAAHSYGNWATVSQPTCISEGVQAAVCTICGDTIYRSIPTVAHTYGSYFVEKRATCGEAGSKYTACTVCGDKQYASIAPTGLHNYTSVSTATCTADGEIIKTCKTCGKTESTPEKATGHSYYEQFIPGTCTEPGYTQYICKNCGDTYTVSEEAFDHTASKNYTVKNITLDNGTAETHLYDVCAVCGAEYETDTFCLDITGITADSLTAYDGIAKLSASGNKLTLTATKYIDNFELSGTASDLTISADAFDDAEIKLCGLSITNSTLATIDDCIRINDKCTDTKQSKDDAGNLIYDTNGEPVMEKVVPTVSISVKDATVNTLKVSAAGGNAIQCETKLEIKGHGTLNMDTISTAVDARAKTSIKNLTMNIKSANRGIDTKIETKNEAGLVIDEDYSNITFGANAVITINSTDDGIRCKNMEFEAIDTSLGDTDTQLTIVSGGDAIQLEGKKGLTMYQGIVTLTGTKSTLNNKSGIINKYDTAQITEN